MREHWWNRARLAAAIALPILTGTLVLGPGGLIGDGNDLDLPVARPAWAAADADQGIAPHDTRIEARMWLAGRDPEAATQYAQAVSSPKDPLYQHYLSPAEFQSRFGPSAKQSQAVVSWARSNDLKVTEETAHYITVTGTADKAGKAFGVSFHDYTGGGKTGIAPAGNPKLPRDLAPSILTVTGLDHLTTPNSPSATTAPPAKNHWWPGPCSPTGTDIDSKLTGADGRTVPWAPCGYTPEQLRTAYGVNKPTLTGKGATIAIVNAYSSPTMATDLARYSRDHGRPLHPGQYREVNSPVWDQQDTCNAPSWYGEQAKDVQAVHAMAPEADIVYLGARNCTPNAFNEALLKVVDLHLADIVSCSWGETSDGYGVQERTISHSVFEQGAIEGIGFYVASGDAGYENPATKSGRDSGSQRLQVDYPAADPLVTAVGGTSLVVDAGGSYRYETGWGQYGIPLGTDGKNWRAAPPGRYPKDWSGGTGGGTSIMYKQPWYQQSVVPDTLSRTLPDGADVTERRRVVPDISMDGDPVTGMLIGQTVTTPNSKATKYQESRSGGTSLACPLFAGMQALVQQSTDGKPLGFANPALYLRHNTPAINDVTDTPAGPNAPTAWAMNRHRDPEDPMSETKTFLLTTGRNGEGAAKLAAVRGFDNATGLGSPGPAYIDSYK
ncbi:protease pro-enzyme activation domain-containing protein [Streptomyces sp. NPDC086549]|uniref:S53 family peptidase n=1 Tax=Streptomyces sp. NPDC086549 TaxID=3365752 RepID=UPI0038163863